jgi:hypothetical protein
MQLSITSLQFRKQNKTLKKSMRQQLNLIVTQTDKMVI